MEDYKKLYEKEVSENILNYDKLVLKYIKLLYLYDYDINHYYYHNLNYLKKVIVGFNYYQKLFIGNILIPDDCSLKLYNLWTNIVFNNKDNLTNLETLLLISTNIVSGLKNIDQNVNYSLILNLFNVYATLSREKNLVLN